MADLRDRAPYMQAIRQARRAAGLCSACGKVPVGKYIRCMGCRQREAAWKVQRRQRREIRRAA